MDPDIPIPSVETVNGAPEQLAPNLKINTSRDSTVATDASLAESSPSRTPFKTPRSHPTSPASRTLSRSPSAASSRSVKRPPGPERKTSTPNLNGGKGATPGYQVQYRRASSVLNPATPTKPKVSLVDNLPQRKHHTPSSVAQEYFQKELSHNAERQSRVALIVHDSCYGHRFARPKTTKSNLSLIVERPERIHATLLGASTAYVRLGDRHKDGKHGPNPDGDPSSVSPPPFDLRKTTRYLPLNHPAVVSVHGSKWMEELQIMCDSAEAKLAMNQKETSRPIGYGKDDKGNPLPPLHSGDLYLSQESLAALQGCLGGVCDAVDTVFQSEVTRRAFVCIRPPGHHCSNNVPSGFCWLNNVHVGITYGAMNHGLTHAAIIDFDLHHGDGSQTITWNHNRDALSLPKNAGAYKKTPIGYYSLHDINSFPCEWGDDEKVQNASLCIHQAHGQSIWNVHLEPWRNHEDFWRVYEAKYKILLIKAQDFLKQHSDRLRSTGVQPKAAIFLSSGFDASQWEGEGMQRHKVNVPTDFYARFTADVVELAAQSNLGVDGRIVSVLEGGYSDRALTSGVLSHMCGLTHNAGLEAVVGSMNGLGISQPNLNLSASIPYEPAWWNIDNLEQLEAIVAGHVPPPKKTKDKSLGSYSSPTHASTAKMTEVARERRSLSAQIEARLLFESSPPEPPPDVDWVIASYELSQLLIPKDRQTKSCTHEELNAEATKARRERQSVLIPTSAGVAEEGRQLRDRKAKPTQYEAAAARPSSRGANRRTTIAAISDLPDPSMRERSAERPRRRSSAASSVLSSFQNMKLEDKPETRSSRPSSRQGSTGTADSGSGVGLKKARAAPKKPLSRTNSPRKPKSQAPAVQRVPSTRGKPKVKTDANDEQVSQPTQANSVGDRSNDGMSELTNGMKKVSIKLNMPTEEQHMANQKLGEQGKQSRPKVIRKPSAPKTTKARVINSGTATLPANGSHTSAVSTSVQLPSKSAPDLKENTNEQQISGTAISSEAPKNPDSMVSSHSSLGESGTVVTGSSLPVVSSTPGGLPVQANPPREVANINNQVLPNSSTISQSEQPSNPAGLPMVPSFGQGGPPISGKGFISPRSRTELPTFTSTSPIPFGKRAESSRINQDDKENKVKKILQQSSIWDIPETPQK